jgi:hypothetical protein
MDRSEREAAVAQMIARRSVVLERVRGLPHVRSVGVGLRVRGGKPTGELAFRVYVDTKVLRAALAPGDVIPDNVEGIPIDVIEIGRAKRICWTKGTRPLVGGVEISDSPFDALSTKSGTLGCMVTTADGKIAALSCEHVLKHKMHLDKRVYQPFFDECLGFQCNKIGDSIDGYEDHFELDNTSFWIDCAIGVLDGGIDKRFRLRSVTHKIVGGPVDVSMPDGVKGIVRVDGTGQIVAIRDEAGVLIDTTLIKGTASALPGTLVWKIGNRTGLTAGVVEDPLGTVGDDVTGDDDHNVVLVRALAGYKNGNIQQFADHGDSGSVVLDLSNRIVGIVTGLYTNKLNDGNSELLTYACNIAPVLAYLKATINVSPETIGPTGAVQPSAQVHEEPDEIDFGERLHALAKRARQTRGGRALIALIERHAAEVQDLVFRCRAVTVVWHRHRGPNFVALLARSVGDPTSVLPAESGGISLSRLITAMAAALRRHGSPGLRVDVATHEQWLLGVIDGCDSLDDVFARLEEDEPVMSS